MGNIKEANYRIVRYNGQYRVEVLDKPIGHWYIVASKMTWEQAVKWCKRYGATSDVRLTTEDIKRILSIISEIMLDDTYYNNDNFTMDKEEYFNEILKRYNNEN